MFAIQVLQKKKEELYEEYKHETDYVKLAAWRLMTEDLDEAIRALNYKFFMRGRTEKEITEMFKTEIVK